jgi:CRISPR-associated endoribonuclease Cas6
MQLIVNMDSNNFEMPYDHSYQLYSSLLSLIEKQNETVAPKLHGYNPHLRFNISQIMPGGKRKFTKQGFYGERFVFIISSLDESLIYIMKQALEQSGQISVFNNSFHIHSLLTRNVSPSSEIITVKSRSPIILKVDNKYYFKNSPEEILGALEFNIKNKYLKVKGNLPNIRFIKLQKIKLKEIGLKGVKIPGLMITFTISADLEFLSFILTVGIGSKNKMGFGFVEEEKAGDGYDY